MVTMEAHAHALVAGHRVRAAAVMDQGRLNERLGLGVDLLWHRLRGHLQQQQHCTALDLVRRSRSHHPKSRVAWQPSRCDQKVAPARVCARGAYWGLGFYSKPSESSSPWRDGIATLANVKFYLFLFFPVTFTVTVTVTADACLSLPAWRVAERAQR